MRFSELVGMENKTNGMEQFAGESAHSKIYKMYLTNICGDGMADIFEMGKISSRGQIAIPSDIRHEMGLEEGSRVMFFLEEDTLLVKKVSAQTWEQLTKPLRREKKRIEEGRVTELIHRLRKK